MISRLMLMLEREREFASNCQPATADVIAQSSEEKRIKIPIKFKPDVDTLMSLYPAAFEKKQEIVLTLKEALRILPRDRARTDSYKTLIDWLLTNLGVRLSIRSRKFKSITNNCEV